MKKSSGDRLRWDAADKNEAIYAAGRGRSLAGTSSVSSYALNYLPTKTESSIFAFLAAQNTLDRPISSDQL